MGVAYTSAALEMEFAGVGGGWTNVLTDVRQAGFDITLRYGIQGGGPTDRVAAPGTLTFALDNAKSGGVVGYYSPNNANKRTGFGLGIRVRLSITSGGVTYYKFFGTLDRIAPVAGKVGRVSICTAVDWMDEASRFLLSGVPSTLSTDADAVLTAILAAMPKQPNATSLGNGSDTYAFAPAAGPTERYSAMSEFQRIAMSELGYIVIRGGTSAAAAGTLTFISRGQLVQSPYNASQVTLANTMVEMPAEVSREDVLNVFRTQVHPRRFDPTTGTPVVLFSMGDATGAVTVDPSTTIVVLGQYSDPAQQAARVSGYSMVTPVLGTDYYFTSNPDGSGTDLSGSLTLTTNYGSEGVKYTVANGGGVTGFFWAQARGYGIYDYEPVTVEGRDSTSVTAYGESPIDLDLFYQSLPETGKRFADYLVPYWKDPTTVVPSVGFLANHSSTHMLHALAREPGDAITIQETTTGVNKLHRIMSVGLRMRDSMLDCVWGLSPMVDTQQYWILGDATYSVLGSTTIPSL